VRLIDANRRDQRQHVYATFEELVDYCDLSANPVGELVLHIFGAATPSRIAQSDAVCTALQLLEHWQDVHEDHANGRIYLPAEDLERFEVAPGEFEGDAYARLMSFEIARARKLLDEGAPLVGTLRGRARLAVAGYVGGGRAGLDALEAGSPRATKNERARASLKTFVSGR
jgi:phytoene/squalene synthetase